MTTPILVFCTFPDAASADRIVTALVEERLIACATATQGALSVYRWNGTIERAAEVSVAMKTMPDRWETLRTRLKALHPYDLPEIVAVSAAQIDSDYAAWVAESTSPAPD